MKLTMILYATIIFLLVISGGLIGYGLNLRKRFMLLHKLNKVEATENRTLKLQNDELQKRCLDLQEKLESERISQGNLVRQYESVKQQLGQQNQMRQEMMNILNDAELARHEAEALSVVKGQFLANISHEIRTPLNGILGMNQLLQFTDLNEEQKDFVDTGLSAADSLLRVVNDILDFSQLEEGAISIDYKNFDLLELVDEVSATVSNTAFEKGIDLTTDVKANVPTLLKGDAFRIKQVLINLVNNAIRFTEKGKVALRITLTTEEQNDVGLQFSVVDTGIGIPVEKQDSLFKPFSQVDGSTTRKYGGTGLGLVISKNLVEAMSGEIHFKSKPESGSEFWFEIPLSKQSKGSKVDVSMPKKMMGKRFLIVDDRTKRRATLTSYLHGWGCRKIDCLTQSEILSSLKYNANVLFHCDVVIVDGELMDEKGDTPLAIQFRNLSPAWNPLVLVISKRDMEDKWRKEMDHTINGLLTSPIHQQSLVKCLNEVCEKETGSLKTKQDHQRMDSSMKNLHILIVEDNKLNQKVVERLLNKMGCKTTCVEDGLQALNAVVADNYDIVLMDYQMPVMNGCVATEQIRKLDSPISRIPIIGLTANAVQCNRETAISSGMNDYLFKPVVFDVLKKALIDQL